MEKPISNSLPISTGVYLYKDKNDTVIYVGKARNLRKRVLSYFTKDICAKTTAMLCQATCIDTITTSTEKEALLLEASLIKKYRPRYNIVLRDDKSYVLFRLVLSEPFPRLEITRANTRKNNSSTRYFGPYVSALAARQTHKLIHRIFPLRRCKDRMFKNRIKPCLYYHMDRCQAPCMGYIKSPPYHDILKSVIKLLEGRTDNLLQGLCQQMEAASELLDFENAGIIRDQIKAIDATLERQSVVLSKVVSLDVIGLHRTNEGMALSVLFIRAGILNGANSFFWSGLDWEDAPQLLYTFLSQFYVNINPPPRIILPWLPPDQSNYTAQAGDNIISILESKPAFIPDKGALCSSDCAPLDNKDDSIVKDSASFNSEIISLANKDTSFDNDSICFLESTLSELGNSKVRITLAQSLDENRLIDMATDNARKEANQYNDIPMPKRLAKILQLKNPATRIECVDVSHISGQHTRVGLVVFEESKPLTSAYRQYSMPDSNSDDYATLSAWTLRRLKSGPPWPDLLLIDGGKGQLSAIQKTLNNAGYPSLFPLAAIAKAKNPQGHADRRAGNVNDRIFLPNRLNPLPLKEGCAELLFLQLIRDTTHNYAIGRHRQARNSAALSGELARIPGIGTKRARLLWDHFENIQAMREASLEELCQISGIGKQNALKILEKLKKGL